MIDKSAAYTLRICRKKSGLTQKQLAELANTSRIHICDIERGKMLPSVGLLCRLADILKMSVDDFLREASIGSGNLAAEEISLEIIQTLYLKSEYELRLLLKVINNLPGE